MTRTIIILCTGISPFIRTLALVEVNDKGHKRTLAPVKQTLFQKHPVIFAIQGFQKGDDFVYFHIANYLFPFLILHHDHDGVIERFRIGVVKIGRGQGDISQ